MAIQQERIFNADVGQDSVGNAGPDALEQDLDNLYGNKAWKDEVLTLTNTTAFTPTLDYHPMTKKFMETYATENFMEKITYDSTGNGVVDDAEKVNGHTVESDVPLDAVFTDTVYTHPSTHDASMIVQTINAQTGTTYTVVGTDAGKIVTLNNADAITVTLPQDLDLAFSIGKKIDFIVLGLGMATFQAGTGATLRTLSTAVTKGQYAFVTAIKIASNTWLIKGDLNTI
jgi:hypothetical protein